MLSNYVYSIFNAETCPENTYSAHGASNALCRKPQASPNHVALPREYPTPKGFQPSALKKRRIRSQPLDFNYELRDFITCLSSA